MKARHILLVALLLSIGAAQATTFESALDNPSLQFPTQGVMLTGNAWTGWKFSVDTPFEVYAIGGRLLAERDIFGAIISINQSTGLPDFVPSDIQQYALAGRSFSPRETSVNYLTYLSVVLQPGEYALVFGGGLDAPDPGFGLHGWITHPEPWGVSGDGRLSTRQIAVPGQGAGTGGVSDPARLLYANSDNAWFTPAVGPYNIETRFVVEGDYLPGFSPRSLLVPEPADWILIVAGLLAVLFVFWRRRT